MRKINMSGTGRFNFDLSTGPPEGIEEQNNSSRCTIL